VQWNNDRNDFIVEQKGGGYKFFKRTLKYIKKHAKTLW